MTQQSRMVWSLPPICNEPNRTENTSKTSFHVFHHLWLTQVFPDWRVFRMRFFVYTRFIFLLKIPIYAPHLRIYAILSVPRASLCLMSTKQRKLLSDVKEIQLPDSQKWKLFSDSYRNLLLASPLPHSPPVDLHKTSHLRNLRQLRSFECIFFSNSITGNI